MDAVILAGGLSKRFGSNKLLYKVEGEEIIRRVAKAAIELADEIVLSVRNDSMGELLSKLTGLPYIVDKELPCSGPAKGILSAVKEGNTLIIPADLPWVNGEALSSFVKSCTEFGRAQVCGLIWSSKDGRILDSMTALIDSIDPLDYVRRSCFLKKTRITDLHRAAESLLLISAGILPEPWRMLDVDRPEDLFRNKGKWLEEVIMIRQLAFNNPYRIYIEMLEIGNLRRAKEMIELELSIYRGIDNLEAHLIRDLNYIGGDNGSDR